MQMQDMQISFACLMLILWLLICKQMSKQNNLLKRILMKKLAETMTIKP